MNIKVLLDQIIQLENKYKAYRQVVALEQLRIEFVPEQVWTILEHKDLQLEDIAYIKSFSAMNADSIVGSYFNRIFSELHMI